ncbi:MAG: methyltransferase [Spirochaetales bacterium]|nr:methyltransferase [Spirochaetales bacterium]
MTEFSVNKSIIKDYTTKVVSYKFKGAPLEFNLSHAVSPASRVDEGSVLLLKALSEIDNFSPARILNLNCGVGILGIAAESFFTNATTIFQDRNSFAITFAQHNYRQNLSASPEFVNNLEFYECQDNFDLVLADFTNKDEIELEHLISNSLARLNKSGISAFIVQKEMIHKVKPLLEQLNATTEKINFNDKVTVFLVKNREAQPAFNQINYVTRRTIIEINKKKFPVQTSEYLKDCQTQGFDSVAAAKLLEKSAQSRKLEERAIFISPNQGYLPIIFSQLVEINEIVLCANNKLETEISKQNLIDNGFTGKITEVPITELRSLDTASFICADIQQIPLTRHIDSLSREIERLSTKNTRVLIYGKTIYTQAVSSNLRNFSINTFKKTRGFKIELLIRKDSLHNK